MAKKPAKKKSTKGDSPVEQQVAEQAPIIISTASVTEEKMQAICDLAVAVRDLARALNSVNTQTNIVGCSFRGIAGAAISVEEE